MIDKTLPLTDLHRHLDGNIRPSTIFELGHQFGIQLPAQSVDTLLPHVQVIDKAANLVDFLSKLDWGVKVLANLDACKRVAYENVLDVQNAGIDYAELRFSPYYMAMTHNLSVHGVVEAVVDGITAGLKETSVRINLIGIMSRTFGISACKQELDAILSQKKHIIAVDLAGDELGQPGEHFLEHFKIARDNDMHITVHAGEAAGAASIWQAIRELGAERIGHGVNAIHDEDLMAYLAVNKIGIESCLTSNIQTNTVPNLTQHPLKNFLEQNVCASINTDDPAVEGIELGHEYAIAIAEAGLTQTQVKQAQINGLDMAFLSDTEKHTLRQNASQRR